MSEPIGLEAFIKMGAFEAAAGKYNKILDGMNTNTGNTASGITGKFQNLGSKVLGVAADLGGALVTGAGAGTAALAGVGVAGVKELIGFQTQMNEVFTLLPGITQDSMDQMSGEVKKFAGDFGVLPEEVVPALYQSLSAGVPPDNVFSFLEVAQKAATGGATDLTTAVDGITSSVNAYGSEVLSAQQASDLMFTAVRLGKTDFTQLSGSLFNVIPSAAALGVNFGDVTAAIAALTSQGTPTSVATTQIRSALIELSKEGNKTSDLFKDLAGKSFKEFIAEGGNTQEALALLENYAKETGVGVNDLFGSVEAGNAALALTGKGAQVFADNIAAMGESTGATNTAYEQMATGMQLTIDKLKAFGKVALLNIGKALEPLARTLFKIVEKVLPKLENVLNTVVIPIFEKAGKFLNAFISSIEDGVSPIQAFMDALSLAGMSSKVTSILGSVAGRIGEIINAFKSGDWRSGIQGILKLIGDAFSKLWDWVQPHLSALWDKVVTWFSGIDWLGIATTIGEKLSSGLTSLWGWVQPKLSSLWTSISTWFSEIDWAGILTTAGEKLSSGLTSLWEWVQPYLETLWTNLSDWFLGIDWAQMATDAGNMIADGWNALWSYVQPKLEAWWVSFTTWFSEIDWAALGEAIITALGDAVSKVVELFSNITGTEASENITTLGTAFETAGGFIEKFGGILAGAGVVMAGLTIIPVIAGWIATIGSVIGTVISVVQGFATVWALAGGGMSAVSAILGGIVVLGGPVTIILGLVAGAIALLTAAWVGDWGNIREIVANVWNTIKGFAQTIISVLQPIISSLIETVKSSFSSTSPLIESFKQLWASLQPVFQVVGQLIMGILTVLGTAFVVVLGTIVGVVGGIIAAVSPLVETITNVVAGVVLAFSGLVDFVTGIVQAIIAVFRGDWDGALSGLRLALSGIKNFFQGIWDAISSLVIGVFDTIITAVSGFVSTVIGFFQGLYETLIGGSIIPDMVNGIITWITDMKDRFFTLITNLVLDVVGKIMELKDSAVEQFLSLKTNVISKIEEIKTFLTDTWSSIISSAGEKFVELKNTIMSKVEEIFNWFGTLRDRFLTIGSDIITSIKDGIMSKIESLVSTMRDVADSVIGNILEGLKMGSPSKILVEIGSFLPESLAIGVDRMAGSAVKSVQRMTGKLVEGTKKMTNEAVQVAQGMMENMPGANMMVEHAMQSLPSQNVSPSPSSVSLDPASINALRSDAAANEINNNYQLQVATSDSRLSVAEAFKLMEQTRR